MIIRELIIALEHLDETDIDNFLSYVDWVSLVGSTDLIL